jgi:tRNA wybutosine-synthesizing protein 4
MKQGLFDALIGKQWAVKRGYLRDDSFIDTILSQVELDASLSSRTPSPIMNRGYFARVECIQSLIRSFLENHSDSSGLQMVNMGCGYDTLSLQLMSSTGGVNFSRIFEVDYNENIEQKAGFLSNSDEIAVLKLTDVECGYDVRFTETSLRLVGSDLCDAPAVLSNLVASGLNSNLPTLVLTECVMVYIEREACGKLLSTLSSFLQADATWITYDMVNAGDPFGRTMLKNLQAAGYSVPGFEQNPSKSHHEELFTSSGWSEEVQCVTMLEAYSGLVSDEQRQRVSQLERFDEMEEWDLLMSHYCLTSASKKGKL